jgi:hypothetical protein
MNHHSQSAPMRNRSRLLFCVIAIMFAAALLFNSATLSFHSSASELRANTPDTAQDPPQDPPGCCGDEDDNKPHWLAGSYYSVKDGLSAKLLLNNKGPNPIEVKPTLFSMGGEKYEVAPVTVDGDSFQMLDVSDWVAAAGPQFREGSIQVFHLGRNLVLGVQIYLEDAAHSLAFEEKFAEFGNFPSSQLRGVWWLPSQKGEVLLALSNTSDSPVTATASADGARPARKGQVTVQLQPHETRLLNVQDDLFGKGRGAMSQLGGISVQHDGPAGAVLARGFARAAAAGYSLAVQFSDPGGAKTSAYQGAGLRLGSVGGRSLTPVVVAYNAGTTETTVTGRLPYTMSDGGTAVAALPEVRLASGETREINVAAELSASSVPSDISATGLEFEYSTEPGSVQMTAFSVGGSQLFRVPMWDVQAQRSGTGGYPWRIEDNSSTYVYLKNTTSLPQEYTFQLSFEGGFYVLGAKSLEPRQTIAMDIRALRDDQVPDVNGNTIPLDAKRGKIAWSVLGPDGLAVIGRSEQADVVNGVSSSYACQYCCGIGFDHVNMLPSSATISIGGTQQFVPYQTNKNCYGALMQPYPVTQGVTWSSTVPTVASVNGSGFANGLATGNTGILAKWFVTYYYSYAFGCLSNTIQVTASGSLNVQQTSVTFQDSNGVVLPTTLRIGFSSTTLAGVVQDRKKSIRVVVSPSSAAPNVVLEGGKVSISNQNTSNGVITCDVTAVTPSVDEGDGFIKAKIGSTVIGTQAVTVVVPTKIGTPHDTAGGGLVIQNIAMNSTTTPPFPGVPSNQFLLVTAYIRLLTITVRDKWDHPIGDVYNGAEVTEVFGGNPELSINSPLNAASQYIDRVGVLTPRQPPTPLAASDPLVAAWPTQPRAEATTPGNCISGTQNIEVRVAGSPLTPAIARSVDLCRDTSGNYALQITWP